jgi:hypothetical protein
MSMRTAIVLAVAAFGAVDYLRFHKVKWEVLAATTAVSIFWGTFALLIWTAMH